MLGVHHLAIKVESLEACERFYAGLLGLRVVARHAWDDGRPRSVWLDMGGASLLMLEQAAGPSVPANGEPGLHLFALRILPSERAAWAQKLAVTESTRFTLYTRDPEGNRVALSHYPDPAL